MRTKARSATILPSFVGLRFEIHNGKIYNSVKITEDMVGHKLGEFSQYVSLKNWISELGWDADSLQDEARYLAEGTVEVVRGSMIVITLFQYHVRELIHSWNHSLY